MHCLSSLLSFIIITSVFAQQNLPHIPQTPCENIFYYSRDGSQFVGTLILSNYDPNVFEIYMTINLSIGVRTNTYGSLNIAQDLRTVTQNFRNNYPIHYKVTFPLQNVLPNVDSISYNSKVICQGPSAELTRNGITTMFLYHNLTLPSSGSQPQTNFITQTTRKPDTSIYYEDYTQSTSRPYFTERPTPSTYRTIPPTVYRTNPTTQRTYPPTQRTNPTTPRPPRTNPPTPRPSRITTQSAPSQQQCGIPKSAVPLVVGGKPVARGQWPWIVAFFHQVSLAKFDFICGATLVSNRHVISAAHCIRAKFQNEQRNPRRSVFYFGKHDLDSLDELDYKTSYAKEFIIHPDWDVQDPKYDADIAIVVLNTVIEYNLWIQPICLWTGSPELEIIHDRVGTIIGWGSTASSDLSKEPLEVKVPVVATLDCLYSHEHFNYFISNRTFCAGNKLKEGPCNGDSGGGLVIFQKGAWRLRGIVSVSLVDPETHNCDVTNHAVFTDAAQFTSWISTTIYS